VAVLTHLGGGLVAGGLYHLKKEAPLSKKCQHYGRKSRRLMSSISETTVALGLGQVGTTHYYDLQFKMEKSFRDDGSSECILSK
jgi:hypothetical protein